VLGKSLILPASFGRLLGRLVALPDFVQIFFGSDDCVHHFIAKRIDSFLEFIQFLHLLKGRIMLPRIDLIA
jgi:hypothetical protein